MTETDHDICERCGMFNCECIVNERQTINALEFIKTIRKRFTEENITTLNIKHYNVKEDNKYLLIWIENNKNDFEIIAGTIRKTSKEERIKNINKILESLTDEYEQNIKKIEHMNLRNEHIEKKINDLTTTKQPLLFD